MTSPLTPREKVEQAVKDAIREDAGVGLQMTLTTRFMRGLVDRVLAATSVVDHEAGLVSDKLTALASGSGDHAELARLCSEAKAATTMWHADKALRAIEQICSPDYLLSLLAGIAALKYAVQNGNEHLEFWETRATEAERKLAEADQVIRDIDRAARQAASMNDAGYTVTVERTATHIYGITDAFLFSKEAEGG